MAAAAPTAAAEAVVPDSKTHDAAAAITPPFACAIICDSKSAATCILCSAGADTCIHIKQCSYSKSVIVELVSDCQCPDQRAIYSMVTNHESHISNFHFAQLQITMEKKMRRPCKTCGDEGLCTVTSPNLVGTPWSRQSFAELTRLHEADTPLLPRPRPKKPALTPLSPVHPAGWRSISPATSPLLPLSPTARSGWLPFRGAECHDTCRGLDPVTAICQCGAHYIKKTADGAAVTHTCAL